VPYFKAFVFSLISTLGSWGYPADVDFWELLAKISPLVFGCLISRLLDSHPHIYLGLMGLSPVVDFWDLSAKMCAFFVFFAAIFTPIAPPHAGLYSEPLFLESLWHYQVFVILARFSTACHGWPLFWDSEPYLHWA